MNLATVLIPMSLAVFGVSTQTGTTPTPFLQEQEEKPKVDYSRPGNEPVFVSADVELLEEKRMPLDLVNVDSSADPRTARGIRMFYTPLEPGKTLKLQLKTTPIANIDINWTLPSDRSHPLYSKIKMAYDNQMSRRTPTISIKNTAKERCPIYFYLSGIAEQAYSVKIDRK